MNTVLDVLVDINNGILAHNMVETYFSYKIIFYINEGNASSKNYIVTSYSGLRKSLENIIRGNLTTTNSIVIATVTVRKKQGTVSLLSRSYKFDLSEYFRKICREERKRISSSYERRKIQWG